MKARKSPKNTAARPAGLAAVKSVEKPGLDQPTADLKVEPELPVETAAPVPVAAATRAIQPESPAKPAKSAKADKIVKPAKSVKPTKVEKKPLNFKVPADFRRAFKTYASTHDLKLNQLLELAFESYCKQRAE